MSDVADELVSLVRGAGIMFAGTVVGRAFGFVGHVLLANALLPTRFGTVGLGMTIVSVLGAVVVFGTSSAVPRRMSEHNIDPRAVVLSAYVVAVPLGVTTASVVFVFPQKVATLFGSPDAASVLRLLSVYLVCFPAAQVAVGGLRGDEQSGRTTLVRDVIAPVVPVGVFVIADRVGYPFVGAVTYYVSIQALTALLGGALLVRRYGVPVGRLREMLSELPELVSFAWPLALSSNLLLLMNNLDVLMIGSIIGVQSVGFYKTVQPLGQLVLIPLTSFNFLYLPIVTRYYERGEIGLTRSLFTATTKWVSILTFPLVLTIVLFPEAIIRLFYRPEYLPAAAALSVYTLGVFARVFVGPNGTMVEVIGQTRIDLLSAVFGVVINAVLNALLIPRFGIVGAALATSTGFLAYNLTEVAYVYSATGIHPFSSSIMKPILVSGVVGLFVRQLLVSGSLGLVELAVFGGGIGIVQIFALFVTRSIDEEDRLLLIGVLDRLGVDFDSLPGFLRARLGER